MPLWLSSMIAQEGAKYWTLKHPMHIYLTHSCMLTKTISSETSKLRLLMTGHQAAGFPQGQHPKFSYSQRTSTTRSAQIANWCQGKSLPWCKERETHTHTRVCVYKCVWVLYIYACIESIDLQVYQGIWVKSCDNGSHHTYDEVSSYSLDSTNRKCKDVGCVWMKRKFI